MNAEILEGLKAALERGQSLKRAMMSFYNAGYNKAEIEEAAKFVSQTPVQKEIILQQEIKLPEKKNMSSGKLKTFPSQQKQIAPIVMQNVSQYENKNHNGNHDKLMIIILVSVLIFLIGILATVFFFREEIMSWFSR